MDFFKEIYTFDENNNEYVLKMALTNFQELFNEWDASAIRKKDLDPDLVDYMLEAVKELPYKAKIGILFHIEQEEENKELESISRLVFTRYFNYIIFLNKRKITSYIRVAILYFLLGFSFIVGANELENLLANGITWNVLSEGLFIGGWVFVWEGISLLFFKVRSKNRENKRYKKLLMSNIYFQYKS